MEHIVYKYDITPVWDIARQIRSKVETLLNEKNKDLQAAVKMVTSELLENAIKYGSSVDVEHNIGIQFEIDVDSTQIIIKVKNRVADPLDYESLHKHITEIKSSGHPKELYIKQLTALIEDPKSGQSQLGLYRIAFEGEFDIDYEYIDNNLTVIAKRMI